MVEGNKVTPNPSTKEVIGIVKWDTKMKQSVILFGRRLLGQTWVVSEAEQVSTIWTRPLLLII